MREIRVGLIGTGFMGKSHALAYQTMAVAYEGRPARPVLELVASRTAERGRAAAEAFGFHRATDDWRALVADPKVDLVDICTPNNQHYAQAMAAIANGKHVYCEKPLALTAAETREMAEAAARAGVKTLAAFNYVHNPATLYAKQLIEAGELGDLLRFRTAFDVDFLGDPTVPFIWRTDSAVAGTGTLGDLGSHAIACALYLAGPIAEVCGQLQTKIAERPDGQGGRRRVTNDDQVQALVNYASGANGVIEASRVATGRKVHLSYEVTGTTGALYFVHERMNELQLYRTDDVSGQRGFRTVYLSHRHPQYAAFFPATGIGFGYNDQKAVEVFEIIDAIVNDRPAYPDFADGFENARVVEAIARSAAQRRWVALAEV